MGKTVNGVVHEYIYDGDLLISEQFGDTLLIYVYDEAGSPIGFKYRTTGYAIGAFDSYVFEKNLQGDIIAIYNTSGTSVATYKYDAWGNVISATGTMASVNPFRYRGYYYDTETGLYYLQSRYYDPATGRFINADDISYLGADDELTGYNLYSYCGNNPVMYADPEGKFINTIIGGILGALIGGITALISGDNIWAGIGIGLATGALSGFALDISLATGGLGGLLIAAGGGMLANGINYVGTELINGRNINAGVLVTEMTMGAIYNVFSYGVGGGSMKKLSGTLFNNMKKSFYNTVFGKFSERAIEGTLNISAKVLKHSSKRLVGETLMSLVLMGGSMLHSKFVQYSWLGV